MTEGLSLDQLRAFISAVEAGSFTAAGRRLNRAQSAISDLVGRLESHIGVLLFDRSGRYPRLTGAGAVLLSDARAIISGVDLMRARAKGLAVGVEPELSVVVDVVFPLTVITQAARDFRVAFPHTPLRLYVEVLGSTYEALLDRRASLGVVGSLPTVPASLTSERLRGVPFVMVASPEHGLAAYSGIIPRRDLGAHTQLVLTDRSSLSDGKQFYVLSPATWRLADLSAKRAFLLGGLGWGGMPRHAVEEDIANGALVVLDIEDLPPEGLVLPMSVAYPTAAPPGPAGRWLIDHLKHAATWSTSAGPPEMASEAD